MPGLVPGMSVLNIRSWSLHRQGYKTCMAGTGRHRQILDSKASHLMSTAVSPLAPTSVPELPVIGGVKLATAAAGIRYQGRTDVQLVPFDKGTIIGFA